MGPAPAPTRRHPTLPHLAELRAPPHVITMVELVNEVGFSESSVALTFPQEWYHSQSHRCGSFSPTRKGRRSRPWRVGLDRFGSRWAVAQ
jgi:hypothetical protein